MFNSLRKFFAQPPHELVYQHAVCRQHFTYINQPGEWDSGRVYLVHPIAADFRGDCDDWAASMVSAMGPGAEYVEFYLPNGVYHAACLYQGWISDCLKREVYLADGINFRLRLAYSEIERYGRKVGSPK